MKGDDSSHSVPLRTILQDFLSLVENYEARRNGGLDSYEAEFQELKQFSESLKSDPDYICKEGERGVNRKKNRYKDILPFDYTRVSLSDNGDDGTPGSDYINANFIKGASRSKAYIACQGPLPHTVNAFWRMLVECEVQVIVMACNEQESGKHKCENYWAEEDGVEREFGNVTVWLKKCRHVCPDFLVRTMRIRFTNAKGEKEERNVCQFHYSNWPDHGVPAKVRPLLDMVRLIRDCQTSETLPVLVHCSAGCGRTGTICAIDYVWGLLRLGRLTPDFSLFNLVREMRRQRIAMVQTKDQYILVHRAVKELFQEQLKLIDSHPYANVDQNGLPLEIKKDLEEPAYETLHFTPSTSSSVKVDRSRSPLAPPPPPLKNEFSNESIVKADSNNIVVSVSNINTNNSNSSIGNSNLVIPLPSRISKSNSFKLDKGIENHRPKLKEPEPPAVHISGINNNNSTSANKSDSLRSNHSKKMEHHGMHQHQHHQSSSYSDDDKNDQNQKKKKLLSSSSEDTEDTSCDRESVFSKQLPAQKPSTSLNGLLRKPSIVKLKSFFEKGEKSSKGDEKEKKTPQLSRAKSDVSARFYSFISSRSSPNKTSAASSKDANNSASGNKSSSVSPPPSAISLNVNDDSKSKKPPLLAKPSLNIKRSKSLKVPIKPDSVKLSAINGISGSSKSSSKRSDKHNNTSGGSINSSNPSTSSSSGFSNILAENNPIKVCVKQVEIPKLQAIVSKSVKPEIQKATTTTMAAGTQEYDYDISDGSHLRQKPITSTTMLQLEQSKTKASHQMSCPPGEVKKNISNNYNLMGDSGLPPLLPQQQQHQQQPSSSSSSAGGYSLGRDEGGGSTAKKPIPPSRIHILKDNHNYVNIAYGNNRIRSGMAREMEDLNLQDNYGSSSSSSAAVGKYGKLKKCDTVNARMISAVLGLSTPSKHERTSLTRSQSHVWQQSDKQQIPVRIFSDENLHQSSAATEKASATATTTSSSSFKPNYDFATASLPSSSRGGGRGNEPSSPTKTTTTNSITNGGSNYSLLNHRKSLPSDVGSNFFIQAIDADVSVQRFDSTSDLFDDSKKEKIGESSSSPNTSATYHHHHHHNSSNSNENPVIRRRVPKTNPYANYPACVTGNNSKFPFNSKLQQQPPQPINSSTTLMDDSFQMLNDGNLTNNNVKDNLPILKPPSYGGGSAGNSSSGSSSNAGTPNSLPSTPTQSVDVLYPPIQRLYGSSGSSTSGCGARSNNSYSNGSQYLGGTKSVLKDSSTGTLSESNEKLDGSRIYSSNTMPLLPNHSSSSNNNNNSNSASNSSSSNIPKIRIAVGVRERRNSFRQAVWKEAAAATTTTGNNLPNPIMDNQPSSSSSSFTIRDPTLNTNSPLQPYSITPYHINSSINTSNHNNSVAPPPQRTLKNYEPIWPDTTFASSNNNNFKQSASSALENSNRRQPIISGNSYGYSAGNTNNNTNTNKAESSQGTSWLPSRQNPIGGGSNNSSSGGGDPERRRQENVFQAKVDEIKIMLAELNAPVVSGKSSSSAIGSGKAGEVSPLKVQGGGGGGNHNNDQSLSKVPPLKQHRSLRAPSRSQYQQGLSCFTFKKPSSCESIDQIHNEKDEYEPLVTPLAVYGKAELDDVDPSTRNISQRRFQDRDRVSNDYVTLQQCKSSIGGDNSYTGQQGSRQSSSSPELPKKVYNFNDCTSASSFNVPIPPPRTKRNLHLSNSLNQNNPRGDFSSTNNDDKHVIVSESTARTGGGLSMWPSSSSNTAALQLSAHNTNGTSDHGSTNVYLQPKSTEMTTSIENSSSSRGINIANHNMTSKTNTYYVASDQMNDNLCQHDYNQQQAAEQEEEEEEEQRNPNMNSTSPKAIIRALGLFQAKAANVRSRFANWSEAKDRSNASKRGYENGISDNSFDREGSEEPGLFTNGFRTSPGAVNPPNGPLARSKHQYL